MARAPSSRLAPLPWSIQIKASLLPLKLLFASSTLLSLHQQNRQLILVLSLYYQKRTEFSVLYSHPLPIFVIQTTSVKYLSLSILTKQHRQHVRNPNKERRGAHRGHRRY